MPLPPEVHVRISSEDAGAITVTPVVHQTISLRDLVAAILATTSKDCDRVCDVLRRGAVVQGASRFRWEPLKQVDRGEIATLLDTFPNPDPHREFRAERCVNARLRAGKHVVELPKEIADRKKLFRRRSFWSVLMELANRAPTQYVDYSFRTSTDEYRLAVSSSDLELIRSSAGLLRYSGLIAQIERLAIDCIEYSVRFP